MTRTFWFIIEFPPIITQPFDTIFSSFRIARRDAARKRYEEKRLGARDDRVSAARERADAIRQKDKATMDMFMQMAKDKFG